jgi:transposase
MLMRKPRIPIKKQKELLKQFASDTPAQSAAENIGVSRNTAYFYYTHFREAIFRHLSQAPRFSGEVEIDEATFGGYTPKKRMDQSDPLFYKTQGDRKVKIKQYKKPPKILLMGIQRRGGDIYVCKVNDRSANSLIPVVHLVVEGGTTIYTDEWSSYSKLELSGYKHIKINHSKKFAQRKGEHVNTLEAFWRERLPKIGKYKGGGRHNFPLHLKEQEFRWNYRHKKKEIQKILKKLVFSGASYRS